MITFADLRRWLRPLETRVANSIARAVIDLVDDDKKLQMMQLGVFAADDVPDAEHFQQYGYTSVPLQGAEAVVLFPDGDRSHPFVVATDDRRYRPTGGQPGEVFLYTDEQDQLKFGRGRVVTLTAGNTLKLGDPAANDPVARKSDLDAIKAHVDSHIHLTTAVVATGGAFGVIAPPTVPMPAPTGSSKVVVE